MKAEKEVKVPDHIKTAWEEITLCVRMIKEGHGRVVSRKNRDGSTCRYTKIG